MVTYYSKFADLDGGPVLVKQLGQAGADKVNAKFTGIRTMIEVVRGAGCGFELLTANYRFTQSRRDADERDFACKRQYLSYLLDNRRVQTDT